MRIFPILSRFAAVGSLALVVGCSGESASTTAAQGSRSGHAEAPAGGPAVQFVEGYSQGYRKAQAAGKPMLVLFTARWCNYCHQMLVEAFTERQVVHLSERFVCILVDADREPEVCREFDIRGFPTIQFLSPRGVPLNRLTGKSPGDDVLLQMQAALQATASRLNHQRSKAL